MNSGHNLSDTMKKIQSAIKRVNEAKAKRTEVNEDIAAIRASLETLGIHKAAFDMALRYLSWEPEKRENFDVAYALVREAGGLPLQGDLFAEAEKLQRQETAKKEEAKPSPKDIADRMFEQTTRGKKKEAKDEPPSPDAAGIAEHMEKVGDEG